MVDFMVFGASHLLLFPNPRIDLGRPGRSETGIVSELPTNRSEQLFCRAFIPEQRSSAMSLR
jgi:hypothetical protein